MATEREQYEAESDRSAILLEVIGPALIMAMVGSLVFFLIEIFYRGPHTARLCWVFGLFTFASVLVSRVSIMTGRERAMLLGIALGLATFVTSTTLIEFQGSLAIVAEPVLLVMFICIVMWSASKLTWDCTVIDSSRDSSAIGITELVKRRVRGDASTVSSSNEESERSGSETATGTETSSDAQAGNLLKALFRSGRSRKNTPGIWVFYFSMAAIPIFGLGQWFVMTDKNGGYGWVVFLFAVYLASGLALMVTTSLLGLQRYLRKRDTHMPAAIARSWMAVGTVVALGVMVVVLLVPRPNVSNGLAQGLSYFSSPSRKSSDNALGNDGTDQKENGNGEKSSEEGKKSSANAKTDKTSGESSKSEKTQGGGKEKGKSNSSSSSKSGDQKQSNKNNSKSSDNSKSSSDQKSNQSQEPSDKSNDPKNPGQNQNSDSKKQPPSNPAEAAQQRKKELERKASGKREKEEGEKSKGGSDKSKNSKNSNGSGQSSPDAAPKLPPPPSFEGLSQIAKLITYVIAFVATLVLVVMFRKEIVAMIHSILETLRNLFGQKTERANGKDGSEVLRKPQKRLPSFRQFKNPFSSGKMANSPEKVTEYTFQALEAWSRDHGLDRPTDLTPHEFAALLSQSHAEIGRSANSLANLYCKVLFAKQKIGPDELPPLKELWVLMQNNLVPVGAQMALAN